MPVNRSTKKLVLISFVVCLGFIATDARAWEIDLSKRRKQFHRDPASEAEPTKAQNADTGFLDQVLPTNPSATEIVIISTEDGFIPKQVRLRKDATYTVYLVNVNEKEKNASFILDAFSEHHGTYFGKIKKFTMTPKKEGVYSFSSPETGFEGRVVVFQGEAQRNLSSQPKD
jgi:hypothetical protein